MMIKVIENAIIELRNRPAPTFKKLPEQAAREKALRALKIAENDVDMLRLKGEHLIYYENTSFSSSVYDKYVWGTPVYRAAVKTLDERRVAARQALVNFERAREADVERRRAQTKLNWLVLCASVVGPALRLIQDAGASQAWAAPMVVEGVERATAAVARDPETRCALQSDAAQLLAQIERGRTLDPGEAAQLREACERGRGRTLAEGEAAAVAARLGVLLRIGRDHERAQFVDLRQRDPLTANAPLNWNAGLGAALVALNEVAAWCDGRMALSALA